MGGTSDTATVAAALELPDAWPAELVMTVLERRHSLVGDAARQLLDLGDPASRALVRDAAFLATGVVRLGEPGEDAVLGAVPQPGSFPTVISAAALVHFADLPLALRGISYLLHPEGELHMLEPIGQPGALHLLTASATAGLSRWMPGIRGLHLARDVPAAVRAEGFTISAIERFTMPTTAWPPTAWPLRRWMQATATISRAPIAGSSAGSSASSPEEGQR